jgi:steroid 5-alpha reductase family enzyme
VIVFHFEPDTHHFSAAQGLRSHALGENHYGKTACYAEYIRRTSSFFPWFPKKGAT